MPKLCWLTDVHLDFIEPDEISQFLGTLKSSHANAFLLTGDISVATSVVRFLGELESALQRPIYFVLGNHDYYEGSIKDVRQIVSDLCRQSKFLRFLTDSGIFELSTTICVLGHDGWADGRAGDFSNSDVIMNDYLLISDFVKAGFYSSTPNSKFKRLTLMQSLADESVTHIEQHAREAAQSYSKVIVLTHFPPFREACVYRGRVSNDLFLPHFANQILGEKLKAIANENPSTEFLVLCGHTHGFAELQVLPNLKVITGGAEYGKPAIQRTWEIL